MIDLHDLLPLDSGWVLLDARGINNWGQIVGYGRYRGTVEAFVLTPPPLPVPTVEEVPVRRWL